MGAEIDRLEIQIEAEATRANSQLDNLVKKLGIVQESLSRLNSSGLTGLAGDVRDFGSAMQSFSSVKAADFTKVANGLTKIGKVPSGSMWNTAYAIGGVAKNLSSLKGVSFDAAGLNDLAKAMAKFGSKNGTVGAENLSKIKNDLANFVSGMNGVGSVTFDLDGLSGLIASIARLGGEKATQAARNLPAMSVYLKKFVADLNSVGGVTFDLEGLSALVNSIAKLGGKTSTQSIKNIPSLAAAMSDLMATLSQAPTVSKNTIQMVAALGELAAQGAKVGSAAKGVNQSLNTMGNAATSAAKKTKSLASVVGSLYANLFWVKRIADKVWESTESSMDFLETVNYFEVAMRDIGDSAAAQWKENGRVSAEAYASSFSERAKELTEKMTGYSIDADGNATYSGVKNLGMDPDTVLQYQATFAQVSSSIGVAEESALNFSKALTMLGADWASLRNLSFEEGWEKFASALAGQSRAVRALGIDITNTTLQEYAYKYGLDQAIQEMNQATKAQLRLLAILDQSEVAYGDLANTIESPSNQMRMLQQNVSNLSRVFGNLFLPILQKTLPYINGVTIALQNLFAWMGNLLGIEFDSINSSMGGMSDEMYDLLDGAEDYEDALDGANDAAKKLKNNLQSWHEINNITTSDDSDSGSGARGGVGGGSDLLDSAIADALDDYEKVWNEAFENMENKAQEYAEKIGTYLQPLKDIIEDFTIGDYFQAGQDTSTLVSGIFNFFADAIDDVDWYGIGQNIGDYLAGIDWTKVLGSVGHVVWEALKASLELWAGAFSTAPLETALITLGVMPKALKAITTSKFITGVSKLASNFKTLWKNLSGGKITTFNSGIEMIRNNMTGLQKGIVGVVAVAGEFMLLKDGFYDIAKGSDNLVASIGQIAVGAGMASGALYVAFGPAGLAVAAITGVAAAICGINDAFDEIRAEEIGISIKNAMSNPGGVPLSDISAQFTNTIGEIGESFDVVTEKAAGLSEADTHIRDTWLEIEKIETAMDSGVMSVEEGTAELTRLFGELSATASEKFSALEDTLLTAFGENGILAGVYERLGISTENTTATVIQLNEKVEQRIEELTSLLASTDPSNPNYVAYKEELASLMAQTDELSAAMGNYKLALSQIDYSELILPDGSLDSEALQSFLNEIASATETANTDIKNAVSSIRTSLTDELNLALSLGDMQSAEEIQTKLDALPEALSLLQSDVALKATELTDTIQLDFIGGLNEIIEDAKTEWGEKGFWGQTLNGVFGAGTESEYVKEAVDQQVSNIEELSSAIESTLGDLKTDSPAWANAAMEALYSQLFDTEYHFSDMGGGKTVYSLNGDFNELINSATAGIAGLAADRGKDAVDGYAAGITDNISIGTDAAKSFTQKVVDMIAEKQESHSPSKVTESLGKDAVDGYNLGFTENEKSTLSVIASFTDHALQTFSGIASSFAQIGVDAMGGLYNGLSSMENTLYDKASQIADNIANAVRTALDIHSPSRVMFALGEYTMEGYQLGLENLYSSVEKSMGGFYRDMQFDIVPDAGLSYKIPSIDSYATQYGDMEYYGGSYGQDSAETNALLRQQNELLRAILQKPNLGNDDIFNAAREVYQGEAIRIYGNGRALDPIWG